MVAMAAMIERDLLTVAAIVMFVVIALGWIAYVFG
jgi:hypothetical protein